MQDECRGAYYCLPQVVASLTVLSLEGVRLEACSPISLPSLKSFVFMEVQVEAEELHMLVSSCPSLEQFYIDECGKLHLWVSSLTLKLLDIFGEWTTIQVEAVNLQTFVYVGQDSCHLDLASCKNIQDLSLIMASFLS
ncbi:hypothetical protein TIFTF001_008195 [Ficus carica]|uniref:At1g61320/AtMIF1 LRR domain-containing protein n=1 Tax=Ficus carica TaxID=3494 RepID=A0AA87ZUE0_FICCA|nr:hypothetical protein TIFTF001_008195 [Ficus carica]